MTTPQPSSLLLPPFSFLPPPSTLLPPPSFLFPSPLPGFLHELIELGIIQIRGCPERHAATGPMAHVEAADRPRPNRFAARSRVRPDEQVDRVLAAHVNERRSLASRDIFEPSAGEREPRGREITDRRGEVQLA